MIPAGATDDSRRYGMTASKATGIVVVCVLLMLALLSALPV
jgi:hypothetical protein